MPRKSRKKSKHHFYINRKKVFSMKTMYNILVWLFAVLCILFVINIYFSAVDYVKKSDIWVQNNEIKFMFIDNVWEIHDINKDLLEHGADNKRDYLFDDEFVAQINSGTMTWDTINTWDTSKIENKNPTVNKDFDKDIDNKKDLEEKKWCKSPRWKLMEHGESVLAYQQRKDVPDICNIQRRVCNDWILWWTFSQKACKTDLPYEYTKETVVLYNEKIIDPLIQPDDSVPINKRETFDTDGKIDGVSLPDTLRNNDVNNSIMNDEKEVDQKSMIKPNCIAPWWEIVLNWQFVKAYKYKNWFIDHQCEVQLRPCMDWYLEWLYTQQSCKHRDISFEDFMDWYFEKDQPSILRIIETLNKDIPENEILIEKWSIRDMIANLWN